MGMRDEEQIWEDMELHSGSGKPPSHPQVFSLIVFSSLLTDGYQNKTDNSELHCVLNSNSAACSFAVGASLLAFLSRAKSLRARNNPFGSKFISLESSFYFRFWLLYVS